MFKIKTIRKGIHDSGIFMYNGKKVFIKTMKFIDNRLHPTVIREIFINKLINHNPSKFISSTIEIVPCDNIVDLVYDVMDGDLDQFFEKKDELFERGLYNDNAKNIAYQMLEGLNYLHNLGIVHRDIKPANILYKKISDYNYEIKLCDLGLAKQSFDYIIDQPHPKGTTKVVTICYRPPELLISDNDYVRYGPEIDMWSYATVVGEMFLLENDVLFRKHSFHRESILDAIITKVGTPESPYKEQFIEFFNKNNYIYNFSTPTTQLTMMPELDEILLKCLRYNPKKRYTAKQLLKEFSFSDIKDSMQLIPIPSIPEFSRKHRIIILDWLGELVTNWNMSLRIYFLACQLFDRSITLLDVQLYHYQLVGISCLCISITFDYYSVPEFSLIAKQCGDGTYTSDNVKNMCVKIMEVLDYDIIRQIPYDTIKLLTETDNLNVRKVARSLLIYGHLYKDDNLENFCVTIARKIVHKHKITDDEKTILRNWKINRGSEMLLQRYNSQNLFNDLFENM